MAEEIGVFGRRFEVTIDGPDADRRYAATIRDASSGRLLTRNPVRGRSPDDARDRALEVMHNLVSIERLQEAIVAVARELAPGAEVDLTEDAHAIRADLSGAWELAVPFALLRDEVYDPEFDPDAAREQIRAHFAAHLRRTEA
ncbi:MAG: hypothetical protein ACRDF6_03320 [bacterium]